MKATKGTEGTKGTPVIERKGYASLLVEEVERDCCDWCASDGKRRLATHVVRVTHYFKWMGTISSMSACKRHAAEIKEEFEKQLEARKLTA